jgi:hypothetical protein
MVVEEWCGFASKVVDSVKAANKSGGRRPTENDVPPAQFICKAGIWIENINNWMLGDEEL